MIRVNLLVLFFSSLVSYADTPNVVVILADDMGYGDVRAFNPQSKIPTPHLDQLASEGIRFTDAHSGGSSCIPSRYALLTGRFAVRGNMKTQRNTVIEEGTDTIASLLKKNGYTTAMVGKWHLGFEGPPNSNKLFDYSKPLRGGPADRGFDSFFGMHASLDIQPYFYIKDRNVITPPTAEIKANDSTGDENNWTSIQGAFWRKGNISPGLTLDTVTPRFAQEAVKFIHSQNGKNPFFLYLALPSPHTPWLPDQKFQGKSGAGMYGDFVMQVDAVVGQVMTALDNAGHCEDTLIIFSSDNGPVWYDKDIQRFKHNATGHFRGMKFASHEGGHRMPFIARWPGKIKPNSTSAQTIVFSDLYSTLAEMLGEKSAVTAVDSVSFLPCLTKPDHKIKERLPIIHDRRTIRDGDWKLILPHRKSPLELFNLHADPMEGNNLAEAKPAKVDELRSKLAQFLIAAKKPKEETWTFVSIPDFLNFDIEYPQKGWEDSLGYILQSMKKEKPAFAMVAGDLVMGHWGPTKEDVVKWSNRYYPQWTKRFADHHFKVFTAIGDHEVGDNPWRGDKAKLVPHYKAAFRKHLKMPLNGPDHMKGTAFYWLHKNALFVSVDVFEKGKSKQGAISAGVTGEQLKWFDNVLRKHRSKVDHIIVMGHTPILRPVRTFSSSGMLTEEGRDSAFWKTMVKYKVDLYLCGEVHAVTCIQKDGIQQVAHGGLLGRTTKPNYMVVNVGKDSLNLNIKEIDLINGKGRLWQHQKDRGPWDTITITEERKKKGFTSIGQVHILKKNQQREYQNITGFFDESRNPKK